MPPVYWHRLLSLFLWISPHVLLGVLALFLCQRRLYRKFPCFVAYVFFEITEFILLFGLRSRATGTQYAYVYYATLMLGVALRFGVIEEVSKDLFRDSQFLKVAARRSLRRAPRPPSRRTRACSGRGVEEGAR